MTTYRHSLVKDDEGWYECRNCKRVSKDPRLLDSLSCKEETVAVELPDLGKEMWDITKLQATQAVNDREVLATTAPSDLMREVRITLREEIRRLAQRDGYFVFGDEQITQHPMTTMLGYTIFKMETQAVKMKPLVLTMTINEASMAVAKALSSTHGPPPASKFFSRDINAEVRRLHVHPVRTDYEMISEKGDLQEWMATVWVRPKSLPDLRTPTLLTYPRFT